MNKKSPIKEQRRPFVHAAASWLMLTLQLWLTAPAQLLASQGDRASAGGASKQRLDTAPQAPPQVKVNRTLPPGALTAPAPVNLESVPTADDLFRVGLFEEPLVPAGRKPTPADNKAISQALQSYTRSKDPENISALVDFLRREPDSPWRAAVLVNLGLMHNRACSFSQALPAWEEAWRLARNGSERQVRALADRAAGELAQFHARSGRQDALRSFLNDLGDRTIGGSAYERVSAARNTLWTMENEPASASLCGPLALGRFAALKAPGNEVYERLLQARSGTNGMSLRQMWQLSNEIGLDLEPVLRLPGTAWVTPSVIHWKIGHYAVLAKTVKGNYLVDDPSFGSGLWVSSETLEREATGYCLVEKQAYGKGWKRASVEEQEAVFGAGEVQGGNPIAISPKDKSVPAPQCSQGMAIYNCKAMAVSLHIEDTPIGYKPPRGPEIQFTVSYNQRESSQPGNIPYSNFGPQWTFNWLSFVIDNPANPQADVAVYLRGGGLDRYYAFNSTNNTYTHELGANVLMRTGSSSYRITFPDGSSHEFSSPQGVSSQTRRVFLSRIVDPHGNAADLFYDSPGRLIAIRDALGQVSTFSYPQPVTLSDLRSGWDNGYNAHSITKITDPFGRSCHFRYDNIPPTLNQVGGRLIRITDVVGVYSFFQYGEGDFIQALTTPYGTSRFAFSNSGGVRWLEMTDPTGATERVEFRQQAPGIPFAEQTRPTGMVAQPGYQYWRNTFYWDKKSFQEAGGDYTRAKVFHWLHDIEFSKMGRVLESEKQPLESRVWYNYPGQTWSGGVNLGMTGKPSKIGRLLDDGSTQLYQYEYNAFGQITKEVDPLGRTTAYSYAANGLDLVGVRQVAGVNEVIETRSYNTQHLPLSIANGSGQTNRFTYNGFGQLLTVTNPRNETTSFDYDTNGYLLNIQGPLPGTNDMTSFAYDLVGRVRSVTDSEGYSLTFAYDALDRLTRLTYPDGTFEESVYDKLDRVSSRDRMGRTTRYTYDANRHITAMEDPLHRTTRYEWCSCGEMTALIDPLGRKTKWHRDLQGRVVGKEYVDGSQVRYAYEANSSRLKSVTDEKDQVKVYDYLPDNNVWRISYLNAKNPTPDAFFTYDSAYNRLKTMTDGKGLTEYGYYPASTNGGRLAFEDGPLPNDTITYGYDKLGRLETRAIDAVPQKWSYDAVGRVTVVSNVLGTFTNTYIGATLRTARTTYPNGQTTDYNYHDNAGDRRLEQIHHRLPDGQTLSRFEYDYDPAGQITNWIQQIGGMVPEHWSTEYDLAGQLISVIVTTNGVHKDTCTYRYDVVGNRVDVQSTVRRDELTYNALNQVDTSTPVTGYYSCVWDAADRLVRIVGNDKWQEFTYDGFGRLARETIGNDAGVLEQSTLVWSGDELQEVRDNSGALVKRRLFGYGEEQSEHSFYQLRDHLGSVRITINSSTGMQSVEGYSPFGVRTAGDPSADTPGGFTGHQSLSQFDLLRTRARIYDPALGTWLSRDPLFDLSIGNLYLYTENDPINKWDPDGRNPAVVIGAAAIIGAGFGAVSGYRQAKAWCLDDGSALGFAVVNGLINAAAAAASMGLALSPFPILSGASGIVTGGAISAVSNYASQLAFTAFARNAPINPDAVVQSGMYGMGLGVLGLPLGIVAGSSRSVFTPYGGAAISSLATGVVGGVIDINNPNQNNAP